VPKAKRTGMPAVNTIVAEIGFTPGTRRRVAAAPGVAPAYRILRTTQVDPYDKPVTRAAIPAIGAAAGPPGDSFKGKSRKAAKLSVASGTPKAFNDLRKLINDLTDDAAMAKHKPPITTEPSSDRVVEEKRNVRVDTFLYAASREDDNDFHLIIGRDPERSPSMYMTVELSGLPPKSSKHFSRLSKARKAYKDFFAENLPGTSYDFYDPPVPVRIEGSLFFDMNHATGSKPGPKSLRNDIPTIWEIHPISKIEFEP
jgi:hypothetical protein